MLLDNKANVNAPGTRTALQAAAENGHIDTVKLLLESKADANGATQGSSCGRTALQAACGNGHIDIVELLLSNGADLNASAAQYVGDRLTSVRFRRYNSNEYGFKSSFRGTPRIDQEGGRTALEAAAEGGHTDIVRLLLDNEVELYPVVLTRYTFHSSIELLPQGALVLAARSGHIEVIRLLLKAGMYADYGKAIYYGEPSSMNHHGGCYSDISLTPLGEAAKGGHIDAAKLLLENGARLGIDSDSHEHALVVAVKHGGQEMVELFLATGPTGTNQGVRIKRHVPGYFTKALKEAKKTSNQALIKLFEDAETKFRNF